MDKQTLKKFLPFIALAVIAAVVVVVLALLPKDNDKPVGTVNNAPVTQPGPALDKVEQIRAAAAYVPEDEKGNLAKLDETGDIYYYADDGNRYIFPNSDIYQSWFGDYQPTRVETIEEMYKTQIKGAVTLQPGSLAMTESDPKVYLVANHSTMYSLEVPVLLEIYGIEWQQQVINLPNWFFAYYNQAGGISAVGALPEIPTKPIIEENFISR